MNYFKNIFIASILFFNVFCDAMKSEKFISSKGNNIVLRVATQDDCKEICDLFDEFTLDDRQKLVVFPQQVRFNILRQKIKQKRFFVATCQSKIIAFIKMFMLDGSELQDVFQNELCLLGGKLLKEKQSIINVNNLYGKMLEQELSAFPKFPTETQCFVYYGGAYTVPCFRGQRINTALQRYALTCVSKSFPKKNIDQLCLVYGQVEKNKNQTGMLRIAADFVGKTLNKEIVSFKIKQCFACKPDFIMTEMGDMKPVFSEDGKGQGTIAVFPFSKIQLVVDKMDDLEI